RVTTDEGAAGADIGKGTVYLHWKTREELFTAVFEREVLQAIADLLQALRQDPQVSLPHRFAHAYFLAIMHRPLLRGFVLGDADLLGKLATPRGRAPDNPHRLPGHLRRVPAGRGDRRSADDHRPGCGRPGPAGRPARTNRPAGVRERAYDPSHRAALARDRRHRAAHRPHRRRPRPPRHRPRLT